MTMSWLRWLDWPPLFPSGSKSTVNLMVVKPIFSQADPRQKQGGQGHWARDCYPWNVFSLELGMSVEEDSSGSNF